MDTDAARAHIHTAQVKIDEAESALDLALAALNGDTPTPPDDAFYPNACIDRTTRDKPALVPAGPANSRHTDPSFGSTIVRVTDATIGGSSWRVPSNAHIAAWNADGSMFYAIGPTGKKVFTFDSDPDRLAATPLVNVNSQCEPCFDRTARNTLYAVGGPVTRTIQRLTIGDDGTVDTIDLLDLDTLDLNLADPRTYVGGLVTSDTSLVLFFGGQGQDDHHYAMSLRHGAAPVILDTLPLGYKLHSIAVDRTGEYVVLYPVMAKPYHMVIWEPATSRCTPVINAPWGHDTHGYKTLINHDASPAQDWDGAQWQIRALDAVDTSHDLITPVLRPKETYLDDHASYHNARADRAMPVITATYRFGTDPCPWRAWDDEVIAISTVDPSTVWRFCHHRSDARDESDPTSTYFWYQPIPNVSPDGRFVLFTSNWEKTLGADPNDAGRSRQDVFLVVLDH